MSGEYNAENIPGLENLIRFIRSKHAVTVDNKHSQNVNQFNVDNNNYYNISHMKQKNIEKYLCGLKILNSLDSEDLSNSDQSTSLSFETSNDHGFKLTQCKTVGQDHDALKENCAEILSPDRLTSSQASTVENEYTLEEGRRNPAEYTIFHALDVESAENIETECIPSIVPCKNVISEVMHTNVSEFEASKEKSHSATQLITPGVTEKQFLDNEIGTALKTVSSDLVEEVEPMSDVTGQQARHDATSPFSTFENNDLSCFLKSNDDKSPVARKFNICEELPSSLKFSYLNSPPSIGKKRRYKLSLDNILSDKEKTVKRRLEISSLASIESDNDDSLFGISPHFSQHKNNRIIQPPSGLNIFKKEKYFFYFCLNDLDLKACGFNRTSALWEQKLMQFPTASLPGIMSNMPAMFLSQFSNKNSLMLFNFKFIAVHDDKNTAKLCLKIIEKLVRLPHALCKEYAWCPPIKEILKILLNYGATAGDHCPVEMLLLRTEKQLNHKKHFPEVTKNKHIPYSKDSLTDRLSMVLDALTLFIEHWCIYKDSELVTIIILLCWLSLDSELIYTILRKSLTVCISACLQKISAPDWPHMLEKLTSSLANLGNEHWNVLFVVKQILPFYTTRGVQLQKCISYLAVQRFLQVENLKFITFVMPADVLALLQNHVLLCGNEDWYLYHTAICLVELCIGNKVQHDSEDAVKKLRTIIMDVYSKISDNVEDPETIQVKQLALQLCSKWDAMCHNFDEVVGHQC